MKFTTLPCHETLQPFIRNYWLLEARCLADGTQHIFSNGAASLQFYLSTCRVNHSEEVCRSIYIGPNCACTLLHTPRGEMRVFGVEFVPFCYKLFFPHEPDTDCSTAKRLQEVESLQLERQVLEAADTPQRVRILDAFFLQRLSEADINEVNLERMSDVFEDIIPLRGASGNPNFESLKPADLASNVCLGQKQFTRVFSEHVGMNPKTYLRLHRFHQALRELNLHARKRQTENAGTGHEGKGILTETAWKCGYYDLAHMTKEFRLLCGYTPSEVLEKGDLLTEVFQPNFSGKMKKKILLENLE